VWRSASYFRPEPFHVHAIAIPMIVGNATTIRKKARPPDTLMILSVACHEDEQMHASGDADGFGLSNDLGLSCASQNADREV
jgi:hypothetical protein